MDKKDVIAFIDNIYNNYSKYYQLSEEDYQTINTIYEVIYLIIIDLCQNEEVTLNDIKVINKGVFSHVLKIGNKVLKIGGRRGTKSFPNNPYICAMLFRREFVINSKLSLFIEVNELVDTNIDVKEEDLYQLYKSLRDINLFWTDIKENNVGKLIRDNKIYWRESLDVTDEYLGLEEFVGEKIILQKNDLIILDNDMIYKNDSDNIVRSRRSREFEERYNLKRNRKKG